ncbi:MAG: HRDC domain-containing protein [Planctomycetota bacterium]|nr:HRDC domain-containing protein [Planctomycetota bacterium]
MSTLKQMALEKPGTTSEFLALYGVGESKLEAYGTIFLEEIARFGGKDEEPVSPEFGPDPS